MQPRRCQIPGAAVVVAVGVWIADESWFGVMAFSIHTTKRLSRLWIKNVCKKCSLDGAKYLVGLLSLRLVSDPLMRVELEQWHFLAIPQIYVPTLVVDSKVHTDPRHSKMSQVFIHMFVKALATSLRRSVWGVMRPPQGKRCRIGKASRQQKNTFANVQAVDFYYSVILLEFYDAIGW